MGRQERQEYRDARDRLDAYNDHCQEVGIDYETPELYRLNDAVAETGKHAPFWQRMW